MQKYMHTHILLARTAPSSRAASMSGSEKVSRTPTDRERMIQSILSELLLFLPKFSTPFSDSHPGSVPRRQTTLHTPQLLALGWSPFLPARTLGLSPLSRWPSSPEVFWSLCALFPCFGFLTPFPYLHPFACSTKSNPISGYTLAPHPGLGYSHFTQLM